MFHSENHFANLFRNTNIKVTPGPQVQRAYAQKAEEQAWMQASSYVSFCQDSHANGP